MLRARCLKHSQCPGQGLLALPSLPRRHRPTPRSHHEQLSGRGWGTVVVTEHARLEPRLPMARDDFHGDVSQLSYHNWARSQCSPRGLEGEEIMSFSSTKR
jgi:hypothetical protein